MTALLLVLVLLAPAAAIAALFVHGERAAARLALAVCALTFALAVIAAWRVVAAGPVIVAFGWLHADALGAYLGCIVSAVSLAAAWYGASYMPHTVHENQMTWSPARYHALYLGLVGSLVLAAFANNLGLLWIAIEASTLTSALLVGFYPRPGAVEAGWKYLILCSVGITFALLATVLLYASAVGVFGEGTAGLQWTALREVAGSLDPRLLRLAFLFALIGYGTKAGLAPMHTWLPDAHSQAPTPVSAVLSAGLLGTALTALLRFHSIAARAVGESWSGGLLVLFGLFSLIVAVPFVLLQGDYKRLLAYSSLENTGFVALAVGFGTPLAIFGGLLHLLVQSLAKTLAFLVGGSLLSAYRSRRMDHWSGALEMSPALGGLFAVTGVALAGLPPSGLFVSEWLALNGGLLAGRRGPVAIALACLALIFVGLAYHWTRMTLGRPREGAHDPLPRGSRAPMWVLAALVVLLGVWLPAPLRALIERAAEVLRP